MSPFRIFQVAKILLPRNHNDYMNDLWHLSEIFLPLRWDNILLLELHLLFSVQRVLSIQQT